MPPYKLVYGKNCLLPIELEKRAYCAIKELNLDPNLGTEAQLFQLNVLEEFKKEQEETRCDDQEKNLPTGTTSKLRSIWTRPYTITQVFPYGVVELITKYRRTFLVNGQRVKHYFGGTLEAKIKKHELECKVVMDIKIEAQEQKVGWCWILDESSSNI
ncbi:reverse transcriptase [Gossypium australe]|uniref:Reverse transcriptase n=1 Tax=Gossypium australe TaxID=47621 RepID=A0A5B6VYX2_9ROSI|nr:reverse transcriptase [Gossypium australe]